MDVYLKYHNKGLLPYWYIGLVFEGTSQLYNLNLCNEFNDFYKNIKLSGTFQTFLSIFKSRNPIYKIFTKNKILQLYDNCLMRVGNMYSLNNLSSFGNDDEISSSLNEKQPPIRYSMVFDSFQSDTCLSVIKDVPLKELDLEKYKYDYVSWMIHRSIQELN